MRVSAEPFPVPPASSKASHVHHRPQRDADALAHVFLTHGKTACADESGAESENHTSTGKGWIEIRAKKTYVAAALIAAGKTVAKSANRTPKGES
jgi:hypothetical protein